MQNSCLAESCKIQRFHNISLNEKQAFPDLNHFSYRMAHDFEIQDLCFLNLCFLNVENYCLKLLL